MAFLRERGQESSRGEVRKELGRATHESTPRPARKARGARRQEPPARPLPLRTSKLLSFKTLRLLGARSRVDRTGSYIDYPLIEFFLSDGFSSFGRVRAWRPAAWADAVVSAGRPCFLMTK